jgi:hypothetical protein
LRKYPLAIVTGAPGAGKSTAAQALLALKTGYLICDIDWLTDPASTLAGKSIYTEPVTWPPYGAVWYGVLHMIVRNGRTPVFFAPTDPRDVAQDGVSNWVSRIDWLLLDCADETRRARLAARPGWTQVMLAEALDDAAYLRRTISTRLDTDALSPQQVAARIVDWMDQR